MSTAFMAKVPVLQCTAASPAMRCHFINLWMQLQGIQWPEKYACSQWSHVCTAELTHLLEFWSQQLCYAETCL